jgi:hypothetical protein
MQAVPSWRADLRTHSERLGGKPEGHLHLDPLEACIDQKIRISKGDL